MSNKPIKYSYSKLNTFKSCGFKYKLTYIDGHYIFTDSLASEFGTLIHSCEEDIARSLQRKQVPDYEAIKNKFLDVNIPKTSPKDNDGGIYGINILKERYKDEFYKMNDRGQSYYTKSMDYLDHGMYRLEKFLKDNPDLEIFGMEQYFSISFDNGIFSGYIDRIFKNTKDGSIIIDDIKTKDRPFKDEDLITPLQFVIYTLAVSDMLNIDYNKISCNYDLPICNMRQAAGSAGYMKRGTRELHTILDKISKNEFRPHPTALCAWCPFSPTNPNQEESGKNLCPYHSLWTSENRVREVACEWKGMEHHEEVLKEYLKNFSNIDIDID